MFESHISFSGLFGELSTQLGKQRPPPPPQGILNLLTLAYSPPFSFPSPRSCRSYRAQLTFTFTGSSVPGSKYSRWPNSCCPHHDLVGGGGISLDCTSDAQCVVFPNTKSNQFSHCVPPNGCQTSQFSSDADSCSEHRRRHVRLSPTGQFPIWCQVQVPPGPPVLLTGQLENWGFPHLPPRV